MITPDMVRAALESGQTVTAVDSECCPRIFKSAFRRNGERVTVADYMSKNNGKSWELISADSAYEMRLDDCVSSIMRLERQGCKITIKRKDDT